MLKIVFKTSILLLSTVILISCSKPSAWRDYRLNGKVKSFIERYYEAEMKFGEWENGDIIRDHHNSVKFNESGDYSEIAYYDNDLNLTNKWIPIYNNNLVVEEHHYDASGELIRVLKINYISSKEMEVNVFDKDGKKIENAKIEFQKRRERITKVSEYNGDNITNGSTYHSIYNKKHQVISYKETNMKGEIITYEKYEYLTFDEKGNWLKRLVFDSDNEKEPKSITVREYQYY